jgi:hypothetical protein
LRTVVEARGAAREQNMAEIAKLTGSAVLVGALEIPQFLPVEAG